MCDTWGAKDDFRLMSDRIGSYQFDLRCPEKGVEATCAGMQGAVFSLPTLNSSATELVDHFVRYEKLFTRYLQRENSALEISMLFQTGNSWLDRDIRHCVSALELTLSIQTSLLDARPIDEIGFSFRFESPPTLDFMRTLDAHNPLIHSEPFSNAALISTSKVAALLMIHSSDFSALGVSQSESSVDLRAKLRSQNLEKGVIRRHRLLFAMTTPNRLEVLKSIADAFENAELPLST